MLVTRTLRRAESLSTGDQPGKRLEPTRRITSRSHWGRGGDKIRRTRQRQSTASARPKRRSKLESGLRWPEPNMQNAHVWGAGTNVHTSAELTWAYIYLVYVTVRSGPQIAHDVGSMAED